MFSTALNLYTSYIQLGLNSDIVSHSLYIESLRIRLHTYAIMHIGLGLYYANENLLDPLLRHFVFSRHIHASEIYRKWSEINPLVLLKPVINRYNISI